MFPTEETQALGVSPGTVACRAKHAGVRRLFAIGLVLGAACSSTRTPYVDTADPCYRGCTVLVAARCSDYPLSGSDDCVAGCGAEHGAVPECRAASDEFYACLADAGTVSCTAVPVEGGVLSKPDTSRCREALCARDACLAHLFDGGVTPSTCAADAGTD